MTCFGPICGPSSGCDLDYRPGFPGGISFVACSAHIRIMFQPKVPTTSVPDSQHPPAQTPAPVLEPLQQLIQQMGGLQQLPTNTGHQSLLHPQPLSAPDTAASKQEDNSNAIQMLIRQLGTKATKPQVCF